MSYYEFEKNAESIYKENKFDYTHNHKILFYDLYFNHENMIIKARQTGITTLLSIFAGALCLNKVTNILFVSHSREHSRFIRNNLLNHIESLEETLPSKIDQIDFINGSKIFFCTDLKSIENNLLGNLNYNEIDYFIFDDADYNKDFENISKWIDDRHIPAKYIISCGGWITPYINEEFYKNPFVYRNIVTYENMYGKEKAEIRNNLIKNSYTDLVYRTEFNCEVIVREKEEVKMLDTGSPKNVWQNLMNKYTENSKERSLIGNSVSKYLANFESKNNRFLVVDEYGLVQSSHASNTKAVEWLKSLSIVKSEKWFVININPLELVRETKLTWK